MSSYTHLAQFYDAFTQDIDYSVFADYYEKQFSSHAGDYRLILDLCCGTGSLTEEMSSRGYDLIGVDASDEMLMQARDKFRDNEKCPLFICQPAEELDLYGTVDACYSSLDSFNYLDKEQFSDTVKRLRYFIRPDGLLIFDLHSPEWMASLDGQAFVDETDNTFCVWRAEFDTDCEELCYGMDLFMRNGKLWHRSQEEHIEYAHSDVFVRSVLHENGFEIISVSDDVCPVSDGRIFYSCIRK